MLGFYGNWTDPSMYDVGSRAEYVMGDEERYPYLYDNNGISGNSFLVSYVQAPAPAITSAATLWCRTSIICRSATPSTV